METDCQPHENKTNKQLRDSGEPALRGGLVSAKSGILGLGDNIVRTVDIRPIDLDPKSGALRCSLVSLPLNTALLRMD